MPWELAAARAGRPRRAPAVWGLPRNWEDAAQLSGRIQTHVLDSHEQHVSALGEARAHAIVCSAQRSSAGRPYGLGPVYPALEPAEDLERLRRPTRNRMRRGARIADAEDRGPADVGASRMG